MTGDIEAAESLAPEIGIALSYTPAPVRGALRAFFMLDRRLGQIVTQTSEPMLGQMRLAWWRDMFGTAVEQRPTGDAVLDHLGTHWAGEELALVDLVNAWEELLAEPPLPKQSARDFSARRAAGFAVIAHRAGHEGIDGAGELWALADAAAHFPDGEERAMLITLAADYEPTPRLPRSLRGVAILDALAARAIKDGGAPLMKGRGAALLALKRGLLG
ncbi:MAG: hypothetical protein ABJ242_09605 [Marinomonas sp.]